MTNPPPPSPVERLAKAELELDQVAKLIESLWLQRHMLYSAIRELRIIKRNVELARTSLTRGAP